MNRPCGVSQRALPDEARIACAVRRNDRATRRILFDAEEAEVLEEAVALYHRGVDRRKGHAARDEFAGEKQAEERVPPGGVV